MSNHFDIELVLDARAAVGEGPVWDARENALWWIDITRQQLHRFDPRTASDVVLDLDQPVTALAPRKSGGFIAAVRDGFALLDTETGELRLIAAVEADDPQTRMNDGRCDPAGRFWAGTMASDAVKAPAVGSMYRLDAGGNVGKVFSGVSISNGVDWSPDGTVMYFIDTLRFSVDALRFDASTGTVGCRRSLISFPEQVDPLVGPDGMCVDSAGFLWVAFWGGSAVRRFTPDGELAGEVHLPVTHVTGTDRIHG